MSFMQKSPITGLAGETLAPCLLLKFGTTSWTICAATDKPQGIIERKERPAGDGIANAAYGEIHLFAEGQIIEVTAGGTIAAGDVVFVATGGKVTSTGTVPVGRAMSAASSGGTVGVMVERFTEFNSSYYFTGTPAATDQAIHVATRAERILEISEVHSVAAGGASVLQVVKDTSTNAPGAGTDLLTNNSSTGFDLNATANTVQNGTLVSVAAATLAAGDRISGDFANAIQSSAGVLVTVRGIVL